ncbi:MAG TPA: ABC transporter permease [Gammaproteobacteria bacterium]|nr:ABC transporter permease [Gammaproteobacteria bacterium]
MLLAVLLLDRLVTPQFFNLEIRDGRLYGSLIDVLNRGAPVALLAIGMSLVIATRGIDLSVGAVMAIAGAVCAGMITAGIDNVPLIVAGGLATGLIAGLINGAMIGWLGLQPIVATLVLMVAGRGIAQLISDGRIITFRHEAFASLGVGSWLGLPMPVILVAVVCSGVYLLTRRTALGLFIEAVGCNPTASHYLGIHVTSVKMFAYVIAGLCSALAGIIATADIQGADANNIGLWLELDAILAVVLGGASLMGGRFSIGLSVVGVLIIQAMSTGIIMSGLPAKYNLVIKAAVVIVVLLLQTPRFRHQLTAPLRRLRNAAKAGDATS